MGIAVVNQENNMAKKKSKPDFSKPRDSQVEMDNTQQEEEPDFVADIVPTEKIS